MQAYVCTNSIYVYLIENVHDSHILSYSTHID
jgi:hypothetical protein